MTDDADNWLNEAHFGCARCGTRLVRVDHSPMYDEWLLYCDRCPRRVEVGFYDPALTRLRDRPTGYAEQMALIEARLRPCPCGGQFRHDAPRRCHACGTAVVHEPDVDVWPEIGWPERGDAGLTDQDQSRWEAWEAAFVVRDDLWRDAGPASG